MVEILQSESWNDPESTEATVFSSIYGIRMTS